MLGQTRQLAGATCRWQSQAPGRRLDLHSPPSSHSPAVASRFLQGGPKGKQGSEVQDLLVTKPKNLGVSLWRRGSLSVGTQANHREVPVCGQV